MSLIDGLVKGKQVFLYSNFRFLFMFLFEGFYIFFKGHAFYGYGSYRALTYFNTFLSHYNGFFSVV